MSKLTIPNILPASVNQLQEGIHLLLWRVDNVPPHLMLAVFGKFYSLDVRGCLVGDPVEPLLRAIRRRKVGVLCCQLTSPEGATVEDLQASAAALFRRFQHVEEGAVTCLAPIKSLCEAWYGLDSSCIAFVFDLLPQLQERLVWVATHHYHLEQHLSESGTFALQRYTMDAVNESIQQEQRYPAYTRATGFNPAKFQFGPIEGMQPDQLQTGWYVVVFRPEKTPVHIGILGDGLYYDVSAWSNRAGVPWKTFAADEHVQGSPLLFHAINDLAADDQHAHAFLKQAIEATPEVDCKTITCLRPLQQLVKEMFGIDLPEADLVWKFLPILNRRGVLGKVYSLNRDGAFHTFQPYTLEEVTNRRTEIFNERQAVNNDKR